MCWWILIVPSSKIVPFQFSILYLVDEQQVVCIHCPVMRATWNSVSRVVSLPYKFTALPYRTVLCHYGTAAELFTKFTH